MKKIYWFGLILFGICLISVSILSNNVSAIDNPNIYFKDSSSKAGTIIYVDNTSFYNNLTSAIYNDDLQTQRIIETKNYTRIQWLTSIGIPIEYDYPLSPMDTNAFNRTQFYFYAQYTGAPKYINFSFEITTLNNGTTFNRTICVSSSGIKYILNEGEFCKSSHRYQVVSLQSGFTRFKITLYQPRWGVISKCGNDYYIKNAGISCYENFGISDKKITITENNIFFNLNKTFNNYVFGVAGQNDVILTDCSFYVNDEQSLYNKSKWFFYSYRFLNITRCNFFSNYSNEFRCSFATKLNTEDSLFNNVCINLATFQNVNKTVFTNAGHELIKHFFKIYTATGLKECIFSNSKYGFSFYSSTKDYNITDCLFRKIEHLMYPISQTQDIHFINCTSDTWNVDTSNISPYVDGNTYRSYSFELKVVNGTLPLSSANVKIYNKDNVLKYSGNTGTNGYIQKQILDYCVWNVSYPSNPYVFSNYKINITKIGFSSIEFIVNNSIKLNLTIPMIQNKTCPVTDITLYENFINSTGTHEYLLNSSGYFVWANVTGNKTFCPIQNSTNLTLFENIFNATGTHQAYYNSTIGWFVYANYTGNLTIVPLNNFTVGLNFTGLIGYINWTGDYTINQTNITFNVSSNMSLNGSVNVSENDYFLSGILTFENSQFFLMLLIGLWLFFVSEYVKYKESMLAWIQLIFAFPVTLFLSSIAYFNSIPLVLPVIFIIPILGIYLVADAIYYSKKPKKNK